MRAVAAACLAAAALLAGCSSSPAKVKAADVAKKAQTELNASARAQGQSGYPRITCPRDLEAKKGAAVRCSARGENGRLRVTVRVLSVDGNTTRLSFDGQNALN